MANTVIALKKSGTVSAAPSALANGELAINYADGKLYFKNLTGQIVSFNSIITTPASFSVINANGSLIVADGANSTLTFISGNNIQMTTDIINDRITVAADLTAANNFAGYMANAANAWANTKGGGGAAVNVGATAPAGPTVGNLWWDTNSARMYIYYTDADSSQWVDASPMGSYTLPNTYVTPATYGGATQIPVITVDGQGRINVAANVAVQGMNYAYANNIGGAYVGNNGERTGAGGTGFGDIFRVHSNTLSTNAYVNTGNNAIAAGPITIAVGQTLTINAGATVTIA